MKWLDRSLHRGKKSSHHIKEWEKVMNRFNKEGKQPTVQQLKKEAKRIEKIFDK